MIIRENTIEVLDVPLDNCLEISGEKDRFKEAIFFDLEHYVYKKPICVGVFGCGYFDEATSSINVRQYMIENRKESVDILTMAAQYFNDMLVNKNKKYIVTFSGNNDFTVINYLFNKYGIKLNLKEQFQEVDLQKEYEKSTKENIGLKSLEKKIGIIREGELVSGSNLAKTFSKVMKDNDYIKRMPEEKIERILLYNEQDVVNLFHIFINWNKIKD